MEVSSACHCQGHWCFNFARARYGSGAGVAGVAPRPVVLCRQLSMCAERQAPFHHSFYSLSSRCIAEKSLGKAELQGVDAVVKAKAARSSSESCRFWLRALGAWTRSLYHTITAPFSPPPSVFRIDSWLENRASGQRWMTTASIL
jgi:hypothetical protein